MAVVTTLLAVALVTPVLASLLLAAASRSSTSSWRADAPRARSVVPVVGAVVAGWWAVLAAASDPPTWGRLEADPTVAVSIAGVAVLVASSEPARALGRSAALTAISVFALGVTANGVTLPGDRSFAAGVAGLALLAAVGQRTEGAGWRSPLTTAAGGAVLAVAILVDDPDLAALVAVAGAAVILVAAARSIGPTLGPLVLPAAVLAVGAAAVAAPRLDDIDRIGIAGALLGAVVALALATTPDGSTVDRMPTAVVAAGLVVATQDLVDAPGAGLLLAAGGVLALAARHPVGLVAVVPGLTASLVVFGPASEPVHAAAGAAAVGLLVVGASRASTHTTIPSDAVRRVLVLAAVAFGVLPAWGWSGIVLSDHAVAVAVAAAFALPVVVLSSLALPGAPPRVAGRLGRRRDQAATPTHGSTHLEVDGEVPRQEAAREEGRLREEGGPEAGAPQHPVAVPAQPVPVRARVRGAPLRGRVRARSRRAP